MIKQFKTPFLDEFRKKHLRDANATQACGVMSFDASDKTIKGNKIK